MARFKKHTPKVEEVRPYLHGVARLLADKLHGPDGPPWGTSLTDIEDLILELRAILSERLLAELLSRQAQAQPPVDAHTCPTCRQPLDTSPPDDPGLARESARRERQIPR